jgi:hypothetical protein
VLRNLYFSLERFNFIFFLGDIASNKSGTPFLNSFETTFATIEKWLSSSILGGSVIYAKRKNYQEKLDVNDSNYR